jgi:aquaporin TIP
VGPTGAAKGRVPTAVDRKEEGLHGPNGRRIFTRSVARVAEIVLTFALVFVVFATAMDPKGLGHLAPIAIGFTILVDHLVGVPLTGAGMNPARSFGPALVAGVWDNHWIYWVGPLIGGGLAAVVYEFIFLRREE